MKRCIQGIFSLAIGLLTATPMVADEVEEIVAIDYNPNVRLQEFFDSLPVALQKKIGEYRVKAASVEEEVAEYNKRPTTGLPPSSFKTAQRKRMKIESQMAGLRLEQKAIAKEYYDLLGTGWEPPNNSNIVRLLVASNEARPTS